MGRILIVTSGPLCQNPRPLKEAVALSGAGHDVTVLTVRFQPATERADRELLAGATFGHLAVDMLPGYGTPAPVVFCRRLHIWLARKAAQFGRPSVHTLGPARALLKIARKIPADLTIVHNELPHWIGTKLLDDGRLVAADIEDWHSEDLSVADRSTRPQDLLRHTERQLLNRAIYCSTTSQALAAALAQRYGGRHPVVITNSFSLERLAPISVGSPPSFFWFSQTIGPGRGLENFADAWAATVQPSRLVLLGESRPAFIRNLVARVPEYKRPFLEILPVVSPAELPTVIARHDIGLALEQPSILSRDLTITNKILQYLNGGLMILATDTAGQREVLARSPEAGRFVNLKDPRTLASELDRLLSDPEKIAAARSAARRLAENVYCWEREAAVLCTTVATALAAGEEQSRPSAQAVSSSRPT